MEKYTLLGLNCPGHDTSAALMINGDIVAACEQERLDRQKHSRSFPLDAINECLRLANMTLQDIDEIALNNDSKYLITEFYLKPALTSNDNLDFFFKELTKIKSLYYRDDHIRSLTGFSGKISSTPFLIKSICSLREGNKLIFSGPLYFYRLFF